MDWRGELDRLTTSLAELSDLAAASALLHWDQETGMPKGALAGRSTVLATLASLIHEKATAPELRERIDRLLDAEAAEALSDDERAMVRLTHRDVDRASRLDGALVRRLAEATSLAQAAWAEAREQDRFSDFAPHLETLLALKREAAEQLGYDESPLDALLDDYEHGATTRQIARLFDELEAELKPLVAKVAASVAASGGVQDVSPLLRSVAIDRQREFSQGIARAMGFDFERGRLDVSAHPFTQRIHPGDVRLTWHFRESDLRPGLFAVIHEAGHGLYEQGLPAAWDRTTLGDAASLGIHESQSRLWENLVARSRPFWEHFLPVLAKTAAPAFDGVTAEAMYRAANAVSPSLIRVEADELTYNLHVILRFRLEREMFHGRLAISDVPAAWSDGIHDLLGVRPATDRDGCLQDIHWSMGAFGYFPTYALGNLYAAQLMAAADRDLGGVGALVARGELLPLRDWLRAKIHSRGRRLEPAALIREATGEPPSPRYFLDYVTRKYGELYRLPT